MTGLNITPLDSLQNAAFPLPPNESERIKTLHAVNILDGQRSPELDQIVELARELLGVPICLLNLVDSESVWLKAKCGMEAERVDRSIAFCNYPVAEAKTVVIENLSIDSRFADNPLVIDAPGIRFYAGSPLELQPGVILGTLCVLDHIPRTFSSRDKATLERLSRIATGIIGYYDQTRQLAQLVDELEAGKSLLRDQSRELELRERQFKQTELMARVGGWSVDLPSKCVAWSDETYRICEIELGARIDTELALSVYPSHERLRIEGLMDDAVRTGKGWDSEFEIVTRHGTRKWVRAVGDVEYVDRTPRRLFGIFQDVTDSHDAQARLSEIANRDPLTGLFNRNRFNSDLDAAFCTSEGLPGLLMVDADHLKEVNDTLGHEAGDLLLRAISDRLRLVAAGARSVSRLGGDEFAVLVDGPATLPQLELLAGSILSEMCAPLAFRGSALKPQVSIGIAIGRSGNNPEGLRQEADLALYHAKAGRRGGYASFQENMRSVITERINAVRSVDEALSNGDLLAWYQPVVELASGRITGMEALARVRHDGQIISIGAFAPALQDARTASRLTSAMMECVEKDVQGWKMAGVRVPRIALNAGMPDFQNEYFEQAILDMCQRMGVAPSQFALEVTETVFLSRGADAVAKTAARLREQGMIIALDDFGTGYASLAHLGTFPVDVIKIDRSFVSRINETGPAAIITAALIELAARLDIQVIAEGVETQEQLQRLTELGCAKAQGYLFSRPLPPRDIADFISSFQFEQPLAKSERLMVR